MRNSIIGVALAVVLLAALFAAAHFDSHRGQQTAAASSAAPSAIKADFIGDTTIGSWHLICGPGRVLPRSPSSDGHESGNSEGTPPREAPPPPGWKLPRCLVALGFKKSKDAPEQFRFTFRQTGFKRALALFLRFSPGEVNSGDTATLRLDQTDHPMAIRSCSIAFCLAAESIKRVEEPPFLQARKIALSFPSKSAGKTITVDIPTNGMAQAIDVMKRLNG